MQSICPGKREHAVVIGGSMAGMLAARVLSGYYQRVTIIDRDTLPSGDVQRRGVPQGATHMAYWQAAATRWSSSFRVSPTRW